jgi:hypothetical protein
MEDDDNKRKEIQANINNIITELDELSLRLSNKFSEANRVETRLTEAKKAYNATAYDDAKTEKEKEEKEDIYSQVLQEYDNVYKQFNILQERHKNLIIGLKEYISLHKEYISSHNKSDNPIDVKDIEDYINEYLDKMEKAERKAAEAEAKAEQAGGKRKSKANSKKVSKKPVVSQKKQSIYKEIFGKKMKIYKMPDSRKEYVKYKGELHHIADYKDLMKQKANAKPKAKTKPKK